jgi:eukaryotic-like serine/threonine-protein kinase
MPEDTDAHEQVLNEVLHWLGELDGDRFKTPADADVKKSWNAFRSLPQGGVDADGFLRFLHEREVIGDDTLFELQFFNPLIVTSSMNETQSVVVAELVTATPRVEGSGELCEELQRRYQLLDKLGEGGMGTVYCARDASLLRQVALKTVRAGTASEAAVARFVSEAQVTSQLDHPNVVPVYALERDADGNVAYALKLVRGVALDEVISRAKKRGTGPDPDGISLDLASRLEIFLKICDGVSYAHRRGVLHRDLKPANVMVGRFGEVYVLDWGLCHVSGTPDDRPTREAEPEVLSDEAAKFRTAQGSLVGTPVYMSPEQASGNPETIGPFSDQFALGLILFELICLELAFPGRSVVAVLERAAQARKAEPPDEADFPLELAAIVDKATALRPAKRYASVRDLAADLRRYQRGKETEALPDNAFRRARRWLRGHYEVVVSLSVLLLVTSLTVAAWRAHQRQLAASRARVETLEVEKADDVLLNALGKRTQRVTEHFLWFQTELEGLSGAVSYVLRSGTPTSEPRYRPEDFESKTAAPPDVAYSEHYGAKISPSWPVFRIAPGADPARADEQLKRVMGLRPRLIDLFRTGPEGPPRASSEEERQARLIAHAVPVEWAEIALESTGVIVTFPGTKGVGWGDDYDPRVRPWYRETKAAAQRGRVRHWTAPYADLMAGGLVISCTRGILHPDGSLRAVVALDLSLDHVAKLYLEPGESEPFTSAALLDSEGRVMLVSGASTPDLSVPFAPKPYRYREVVDAIKEGRQRGLLRVNPARSVRVAWQHLGLLEWTLVVEAPVEN